MNNTPVNNYLHRTFSLPLDYFLNLNFHEEYCWIRGFLLFEKLRLTFNNNHHTTKNKLPYKNRINLPDDFCFACPHPALPGSKVRMI